MHMYICMQAMSERTKEIDVHKEMLRAEIKVVESDRQTARFVHACVHLPHWISTRVSGSLQGIHVVYTMGDSY